MGDTQQWHGDNPYYLMIRHAQDSDGKVVITVVDLDEKGWATTHKELMRKPGRWYLVHKEFQAIHLAMVVEEGDQPYYVARHVGIGSGVGVTQAEVIAYGIGKKRPSGHVERLWRFPQGLTVTGDDVNPLGIEVLKALSASVLPQATEQRTLAE